MKTNAKARKFAKALVTRTLEFDFELVPYRLEGISAAKILTLLRSEMNCLREAPRAPWYPVQVQIEPSRACTLKCPLCPAGLRRIDEPGTNMPFSMFRSVMDEVGDHAVMAILWMWGEPFINRKLPDLIAYARSKNIATVTSTNGQHIRTTEDAESIVASGLDCLVVALDGATQEVYSTYRVGGDVAQIIRGLDLIRQAKDSMGSSKPLVNVRTVVMKHNEHELPEIERIAREHGADLVTRKTACMADNFGDGTDERFAPSDPRYRRFAYKDGQRVRKPISQFRCRRPWNRIAVTSDGVVIPCEFDYNKVAAFGRGGDCGSFLQAWRGQTASAFRRQFVRDKSAYRFCVDCHYRDRSGDECVAEMIRLRV